MKDRAPAFQFYPRQFAGDDQVMGLDLDAIGAHILLMCYAASSPEACRIACRNDADEYAIRMRLRNPGDEQWERIKRQLLAGAWKLSEDGQWWIQEGLLRTFNKQKRFSEEQRKKANARWDKNDAERMPESCRTNAATHAGGVPKVCSSSSSSSSNNKTKAQSFNSTEVAQVLCSANGWSGKALIWAVQAAIEFQAKRMPEIALQQVGEWLLKAYADHKSAKGKFAVAPQKFFEQALYCAASDRREATANILNDNPATRALAQMEAI